MPARKARRGARPERGGRGEVKEMRSFRLAADKIRRARQILGTTSDTSTIETALDLVVFRKELLDGLAAMAGADIVTPEMLDAAGE